MRVISLNMPLVKRGDDLPALIVRAAEQAGGLRDGDILVIASKVLAVVQGRLRKLARIHPSPRARKLATNARLEPEFVELVLREADEVLGASSGVILTLKGGILCANAGVDRSNVPLGRAALMPLKPNRAAREVCASIVKQSGAKVGVIISDSNVKPLRLGTVGQAIGIAGFEPVIDCRGQRDLYGRPLHITFRAIADQLASAAQAVMGEAAERLPVVIVRDMNIKLIEEPKRSPKIAPKRCIYFSALKPPKKR